jgi:type IV pilus assembly protein PilE
MKPTHSGFTIVELMVVIGIVGILAVIAYPQYTSYITKSKRADAKVALSSLAQEQESYKADNIRSYASVLGNASNFTTNTLGCKRSCQMNGSTATTQEDTYELSIETLPDRNFTTGFAVTAVAQGQQAANDERCLAFAIDSLNRKASSTTSAADAIARLDDAEPDPNNCWD